VREVYRERPLLRVIFDRRLRTPPAARVFTTLTAGPIVIVTSHTSLDDNPARVRALQERGAIVDPTGDGHLGAAIGALTARHVNWLILEGGARLHEAALREGLVDRIQIYRSPSPLGRTGTPWLADEELARAMTGRVETRALGPDTLIEADVHWAD
jgi:diaminohydroxyphosphoribosylaminopyrimidine deaminase/5-amino-6-(5-phosphoribosylamino)uracil reductase